MVPRAIKEAALLLGGLEAEGKQRLCKNPAGGGGATCSHESLQEVEAMAGARLGGQEDRICYLAENILVHYLLTHSFIHSCMHSFIQSFSRHLLRTVSQVLHHNL